MEIVYVASCRALDNKLDNSVRKLSVYVRDDRKDLYVLIPVAMEREL